MSPRGFAVGVVAFFSVLTVITLVVLWRQAGSWQDQLIDEHVLSLRNIFMQIDADCEIIDFEHQKNYIDFLNVIKFEGSEVGPMNLVRPENWKGAYVQDNPTMQEKYYQVVRTFKGYYIVPGEGVQLSNGKIIGKDIIFDEQADISAMIQDRNALLIRGYALAAHLPIGKYKRASAAIGVLDSVGKS